MAGTAADARAAKLQAEIDDLMEAVDTGAEKLQKKNKDLKEENEHLKFVMN